MQQYTVSGRESVGPYATWAAANERAKFENENERGAYYSAKRVGSLHEETPRNGTSYCNTCHIRNDGVTERNMEGWAEYVAEDFMARDFGGLEVVKVNWETVDVRSGTTHRRQPDNNDDD